MSANRCPNSWPLGLMDNLLKRCIECKPTGERWNSCLETTPQLIKSSLCQTVIGWHRGKALHQVINDDGGAHKALGIDVGNRYPESLFETDDNLHRIEAHTISAV